VRENSAESQPASRPANIHLKIRTTGKDKVDPFVKTIFGPQ